MNHNINVEELTQLLNSPEAIQLIDVRSPGEFAAGHVPRAINMPLEQIESRLKDLDTSRIAILCQSGRRAGLACETLRAHHDNVWMVEGGTQAWIAAGNPVTEPVGGRWSLERQVRLLAGLIVLSTTILTVFVSLNWVYVAMFVGAGLTFAGLTNICGMATLLGALPWNRPTLTNGVKS